MKTEVVINGVTYPMYHTMRHAVEMSRADIDSKSLLKLKNEQLPATAEGNIIGINVDNYLHSAYWLIKGACLREQISFPFTFEAFIDCAPDNILELHTQVTLQHSQGVDDKKKVN